MAESPSVPEDEWKINCILCKQPLELANATVTVKAKGIKTLIQSSKIRCDPEIEKFLSIRDTIQVHSSCSKTYNSKQNLKYISVVNKTEPEAGSSTRSTNIEFDFTNNCFYCGDPLHKRRVVISRVTSVKLRETLLKKYSHLKNSEAEQFINRISLVPCLVEAEASYHRKCQIHPPFEKSRVHVSDSASKKDVTQLIIDYLSDVPNEAQFSVNDILSVHDDIDNRPNLVYLKYRLQETFGYEFVIQISKDDIIISKMSLVKLLFADNFFKSRLESSEVKRLQKIDESSTIIYTDILKMKYDLEYYPPQDQFLKNSDELVPVSLRRHLSNLISKNKGKSDDWKELVNSIAHAIIASTKPKLFVSPVLVNVASVLHRMYGSKELIQLLHANGFSASYEEVHRYISSVITQEKQHEYSDEAFTQIVYDNADHNVETSDGRNTFHVMAGITPKSAVSESEPVKRLRDPLTAEELSDIGKIGVKSFHKTKEGGFKNIELQDIDKVKVHEIPEQVKVSELDFCFLYARAKTENENFPGFHGFMERVMKNDTFQVSKIKVLPFINAPASHPDTIYTALPEAEEIRKKVKQEFMFVTMDSPLFWKGQEVETHVDLQRIILRLGGFHLCFSFTSSIYYIMNGSGLRELFLEMFAENSCDKVLNGTAYTRSVRAHLMMHAVLGKLILDACDFTKEEADILSNITSKLGPELREYLQDNHFKSAYKKFHNKLEELENRGPTARLWILYFRLLTIMKLFIQAERSGDWDLHLESCHRMLPIFLATGHFHYFKCLLLYLQQMVDLYKRFLSGKLEGKAAEEIRKFTKLGYFTIRRSNKFWSGVWSDMTIEQTLMRLMKSRGGLTHGRGVTENVQSQWTLSTPAMVDMSSGLQAYSKVNFTSGEQHKDSRQVRMKRDYQDIQKCTHFFKKNNPFPFAPVLVSLSTGIMGNVTITCHNALIVGQQLLREQIKSAKTFDEIKCHKKNLVVPLQAAVGKIAIDKEETITVNPTLIFQRIAIAVKNDDNLMKYLGFELAPYPVSIFENGLMHKTDKSKFILNFNSINTLPEKKQYIIDGGYLLKKVVWNQSANNKVSYGQIAQQYINYLQKLYPGCKITIVFDGYSKVGTKSAERIRRKAIGVCRPIKFDEETPLVTNQADFLSNDENKTKFICFLKSKLVTVKEFSVLQAVEDADTLIVDTAIQKNTLAEPSVIVGSDTDLLVIMTQRTPSNVKIYFLRDVKNSITYYDSHSFKYKHLNLLVLLLYAFTGCDTTSAFYKQGKHKLLKAALKNEQLAAALAIFNNPKATKSEIAAAGNKAIMTMYGALQQQDMSSNEFRYHCYENGINKPSFTLRTLPPSESAAIQHSYRVYYQVHLWLGRTTECNHSDQSETDNMYCSDCCFKPTNWGWKFISNMYKPVFVDGNLVPDDILKIIRCKCSKNCKSNCGCVKHGLKCSEFCASCRGENCLNKQETTDLLEENEDEGEVDDELDLVENENSDNENPSPKRSKLI